MVVAALEPVPLVVAAMEPHQVPFSLQRRLESSVVEKVVQLSLEAEAPLAALVAALVASSATH